jgi:DMSO/TMAO reductase YedYZ heme-binding membrane subunit
VVLFLTLAASGSGKEGWELAARHTGRVSALWFLMVFAVGPLHRQWRSAPGRALLRERRGLGLAFAAAHTVHLGAIFGVLSHSEAPDLVALAGGGLAYLLMFAMAATSNDAALRWLGARTWRGLHATGVYYPWFIFFTSYLGNLVEASPGFEQWLLAAAFGGLFLWRVGGGIARRLAARG